MDRQGCIEPINKDIDPRHHGFKKAKSSYNAIIEKILTTKEKHTTFDHTKYYTGMAQCLILDQFVPEWKNKIRKKGTTPFDFFEQKFPLTADEQTKIFDLAKEKFRYNDILKEQKERIQKHISKIRIYLEGPGFRYRIYSNKINNLARWKYRGDSIKIPDSLMTQIENKLEADSIQRAEDLYPNIRSFIYTGGIEYYEKGGFSFKSNEVPILFRGVYFEWINPKSDKEDKITYSSLHEGILFDDFKLVTDGFVLQAPRASIKKTKRVISIYPLSKINKKRLRF